MKNVKKFLAIALSAIMIFTLAACGDTGTNNGGGNSGGSGSGGSQAGQTGGSGGENNGGNAAGDDSSTDGSGVTGKVLVAYFSASGNTERVAGFIASAAGGTLFEIEPVDPYTSADLNWTNSSSRVVREHNDESLRDVPLVKTTPDDWSEYDTVFIGYPIWWGIAGWGVNNFVKNNDFDGKTVIPFATSSSSGMGDSGTLLKRMAGDKGTWLAGQRFSSGASEKTVTDWVNGLKL